MLECTVEHDFIAGSEVLATTVTEKDAGSWPGLDFSSAKRDRVQLKCTSDRLELRGRDAWATRFDCLDHERVDAQVAGTKPLTGPFRGDRGTELFQHPYRYTWDRVSGLIQ